MEYTNEVLKEFYIIGTSTNISGTHEEKVRDVLKLWKKFLLDDIFDEIPNRIDDRMIVAYTDYNGEPFGSEYKVILGVKVDNLDEVPPGLTGKKVASSEYAAVPVSGTFPDSLINAWEESFNLDIDKKYDTDLEIYPTNFDSEKHCDMTIYISKK